MQTFNKSFSKLFLYSFLFISVSCVNTKNAIYFNNLSEGTINSINNIPEIVIQNNDLLSINISSLSAEASKVFNSAAPVTSGEQTGILVGTDGFIQLPVLGNIKAQGLTKNGLKETITKALLDRKLLVDPIVSVQILNFKITMLGEVGAPSVIRVPSEKISILEAIGLAGDISSTGRKDNVLLIREEGGQKIAKRLNLNSTEIFTSPYFYMKSNDVVIVEPNKAQIVKSTQTQPILPLVLTGLSIVISLAYIFINN